MKKSSALKSSLAFCAIGIFAFLFATYSSKSEAQQKTQFQHVKPVATKPVPKDSIKEINCDQLSKVISAKSVIIDGIVVSTEIQGPVGDAPHKEGYDRQLVIFIARLKEITNKSDNPDFYVYTKSEARKDLEFKGPYMEVGKRYSFCAHKVKRKPSLSEGKPVYEIDSAKSIREVK